jgi:glycosyltransferase involved in cell wall biosynthesis
MNPTNRPIQIIYLTVNDAPSGIYTGQVIDVVNLLRERSWSSVRLVAFVPLVLFRKHSKAIKLQMPDAIVLPMFPFLRNWKLNVAQFVLTLGFMRHSSIIARNPLAANLALTCRKLGMVRRVCYDGRGAVAAEAREYQSESHLVRLFANAERRAVCDSDFRIAVSSKLVKYWQSEFDYSTDKHVIIPCSYSARFERFDLNAVRSRRRDLGFSELDVVFVFAGGTSSWQSAELFVNTMKSVLSCSPVHKLLMLSKDPALKVLEQQFPGQVKQIWLDAENVPETLGAGDYGLLLREPTVTNQVAAPVKFAEYLACGLPVICSECIGDYPDFLIAHGAGIVLGGDGDKLSALSPVSWMEKERIRQLAEMFFSKNAELISSKYSQVVRGL